MQYEFSLIFTLAAITLLTLRPQLAFELSGLLLPENRDPDRKAWEDLLMFKKGSSKAPAPDPNIGKAALKEAELGEQWLSIAKEQFATANARQTEQDKLANKVTEQQLAASQQAQGWATEDRERYKSVFQPLQDEFIDTAQNWDSPERQDKLAAEAKADVMSNAAAQRGATARAQAGMGVNPTSGRYAGVDRAGENATALAAAGAENSSRNQIRKEGVAMKADAVNLGNGLAVNPASSLGLGVSAGSSAMGTTSSNNAQAAGNSSILQNGFNSAMNGYSNQASILNQQYGNQLNAWNAQQQASASASGGLFSGLGSVAGMGLMAFMSSKELKEGKEPVEGALAAIESMPVESWKYKDGVADGGRHIGPYAEDFQRATGKGDGKSIPVVDAMGITMKAVQELSTKVDKIAGGRSIKRPERRAS